RRRRIAFVQQFWKTCGVVLFRYCAATSGIRKIGCVACLTIQVGRGGLLRGGIMDRRRLTAMAVSCVTAYVTGCTVAWNVGLAPSKASTGDVQLAGRHQPSLPVDADIARARGTTAISGVTVRDAGRTTLVERANTSDTTMALQARDPVAEIGFAEPSQPAHADTPPIQLASANPNDPVLYEANQATGAIEIFDECLIADPCVDRYLWALYERTPKEDTIKVEDRRKVKVKRKGKTITVTRTFTRAVDEDFAWK